jgi:hypothetical protein
MKSNLVSFLALMSAFVAIASYPDSRDGGRNTRADNSADSVAFLFPAPRTNADSVAFLFPEHPPRSDAQGSAC